MLTGVEEWTMTQTMRFEPWMRDMTTLGRDDFRYLTNPGRLVPRFVVHAWGDLASGFRLSVVAAADAEGWAYALSVRMDDPAWGRGPGGMWESANHLHLEKDERYELKERAREAASRMRAPASGARLTTGALRDVQVARIAAAAVGAFTLVPATDGRPVVVTDERGKPWGIADPVKGRPPKRFVPDAEDVWMVIERHERDGLTDSTNAVAKHYSVPYGTARRWVKAARESTGNDRGRGGTQTKGART
jgi:hypothetical protein